MKKEELKLNNTDYDAISFGDRNYLCSKGAKYYNENDYAKAIEYYHLASTLGDPIACTNLGNFYLYGRSVTPNVSLAIAYFKIAARAKSIEALYKLGDIYGSNKWKVEDKELSAYYYMHAMKELTHNEQTLYFSEKVRSYPSLCFALAREELPGGHFNTNIDEAYELLRTAKIGYKIALINGKNIYEKEYNEVCKYLKDTKLDNAELRFRKKYGVNESDDFIDKD